MSDKYIDRFDVNEEQYLLRDSKAVRSIDGIVPDKNGNFVSKITIPVSTEPPINGSNVYIDPNDDWEGGESGSVAQPDWNASKDEDGHILNRTHFVDKNGIVRKLDNKFIDADWMATSEDYTDVDEIIPEQQVTSTWNNLQYSLQAGVTYDVIINGMTYPCVAWGSGAIQLGNNTSLSKNDYPFSISWAGGTAKMGMFFYDKNVFSSPIYLKVTEHSYKIYNKLPEEFLPDGVAKTLIGTTSEVKPSEVAAALAEGRTVAITFNKSDLYGDITFNSFIINNGTVHSSETVLTNVYQISGSLSTDTWSFFAEPVSSGGSANIDVTAKVGQTIVVEEVDSDGKPTKWRAVDMGYHYFDIVDLLPEQTLPEAGISGKIITIGSIPLLGLIEGETYTYTFDGATYTSVATKFENLPWNDATISGVMIGNFGMLDAIFGTTYGDNGQPVIFLDIPRDGWGSFVPAVYGAYTASINGKKEILKKLDPYIVPSAYYIDVTCETSSNASTPNVYTCNDTVENVKEIIRSGREVKVRVRTTGHYAVPWVLEYHRHIYAESDGGLLMGFFSSSIYAGLGVQLLFLMSQKDGTFAVGDNIGD